MSTSKSALNEYETPPNAGQPGLPQASDSVLDLLVAEDNQRALLNILEDFASEKKSLEQGQRAMLNILDDFDAEKARMEGAQRAVLNILDDSLTERSQLEAAQRSMLNILDDFASEKTQLESAQGALVNILDDFSQEKGRLEQTQRAVLNILDDFEAEKSKVELVNTEVLAANKELEAFSYSVSHDLRAPLRGIDGFSLALLEDYADKLDDNGRDYLRRVRAATQRMGVLIDDLLNLSRVTRTELRRENSDLGVIARSISEELQKTHPERCVEFRIEQGLEAYVDPHLTRIALENLIGNAWKFTSKRESSCIEFGRTGRGRDVTYFVRDNGAGFNSAYADRLFGAFQRLHDKNDFPGTGVGLATVQRIINRHGGRIWAESALGSGATFYFTITRHKEA
jgi:light-regulated signal transduction histidine kinase (bacteriophytochrome)